MRFCRKLDPESPNLTARANPKYETPIFTPETVGQIESPYPRGERGRVSILVCGPSKEGVLASGCCPGVRQHPCAHVLQVSRNRDRLSAYVDAGMKVRSRPQNRPPRNCRANRERAVVIVWSVLGPSHTASRKSIREHIHIWSTVSRYVKGVLCYLSIDMVLSKHKTHPSDSKRRNYPPNCRANRATCCGWGTCARASPRT